MIFQPSLEESRPKGQGRARNIELILTPEMSLQGGRLGDLDQPDGLGRRPDSTNLGKEEVLPEAEPHRVHHRELPLEKLSEEPRLEPMKVSRIATAGRAVQRDISLLIVQKREE